jgi:alkylresorcinol/alkylpyrone synthase
LGTALADAGLEAPDVDFVMFTSVTGISAPSIDALLVSRLGLRPDVKRMPSFGLGCVAGAAGLARVNDYLVGHPDEVGVLLAVELCSLTFQPGDESTGNLVATGLFGDGAAAVVMVGTDRARRMGIVGPDVVDTASRVYPDSEQVIGFTAGETGFRIQLTAQVGELIEHYFEGDVVALLDAHGLSVPQIDRWVAHPGGPRVLEAFESSLALRPGTLDASWASLAAVGNLSSVSVLHILEQELRDHPSTPGEHGLLFALGPGVSAELVLLEWAA